jgi:hypothetical protein
LISASRRASCLQRLRFLLALGSLAVGRRLRDPRVPLDRRRLRPAEIADIPGRVVDLLDLERVDDEPELLHVGTRRLAGRARERLAVADHRLDGHAADDCAQVPGEQLLHLRVHPLLAVEEAARGVGDRGEVVRDLEDRHAADAHRDPLVGDALDRERRLAHPERQAADGLEAGQDERPLAGHDLEAEAVARALGAGAGAQAGDDERLVRLRDAPHQLEQDRERDQGGHRGDRDDLGHSHIHLLPLVPAAALSRG